MATPETQTGPRVQALSFPARQTAVRPPPSRSSSSRWFLGRRCVRRARVRLWWRVSKRGRWYAISKRRAFRALMPDLRRELRYLEVTRRWPAD
jgi:hypothetical protein